MQENITDLVLIRQVLDGRQAAYALLVKRHQRYVFTLALRFTKSREDAEEVAQDVFVKVYRSLASYQGSSKFTTWLYTIVYHTAMTKLRKKVINTSSIDDEDKAIQIENQFNDDICQTEKKSRSFYVNQAISQLMPNDATIITLFYQGEQSLDEIAKVMDMEANAVKVKLHRARHRLKEKLEYLLKEEVKELI